MIKKFLIIIGDDLLLKKIINFPINKLIKYMIFVYLLLFFISLLNYKYSYISFSMIIIIQGIISVIRPSLLLELMKKQSQRRKERNIPTLSDYIDIEKIPFISSRLNGVFLIIIGVVMYFQMKG